MKKIAKSGLFELIDNNICEESNMIKIENAIKIVQGRVLDTVAEPEKINNWKYNIERMLFSKFDLAIRWRAVEIISERDPEKMQYIFDYEDQSINKFESILANDSKLLSVAEWFLYTEFGIPYYFGREKIEKLSSNNISQYISVVGSLYDEIITTSEISKNDRNQLSAERQQELICTFSEKKWDELLLEFPHGNIERKFLETLSKYFMDQSIRPTAPYAPGVTGFAITADDSKNLIGYEDGNNSIYPNLKNVLTLMVSHNILFPRQVFRNEENHIVFYLNRLFCAKFKLPLGYGGWREIPINHLAYMLNYDF